MSTDQKPQKPEKDNVVPLKPEIRPTLDPRLEELRRILQEAEPVPGNDAMSDERVIEDGHAFRQRFGYGFDWPRRHREALIQLKHEKKLTDAEIKLFRRTGNLLRTPLGIKLAATRGVALAGAAQLAMWIAVIVVLITASLLSWGTPTFKPYKAIVLFGLLLVLCYGIYWLHLKPWFIQRRVEQADKERSD